MLNDLTTMDESRAAAPRAMRAALAVLLSLGLAGCLGVEAPSGEPRALLGAASSGGGAGAGAAGLPPANLSVPLHLGGEAVHVVVEEDGTFQGPDAWWPAHFALWAATQQDQPSAQFFDLADRVPKGVPVRVRAQVEGQVAHGSMGVFVDAPPTAYYDYRAGRDGPGAMWVEVLLGLGPADAAVVAVTYGDPEPAPTVPYHLTVSIDYDPAVLPAGVPVAVTLGPGAALDLAFADGPGEAPALLVFGPGDELVARDAFSGPGVRFDLGPDAAVGEYVMMLAGGSGDATVLLRGLAPDAPAPRPLRLALAWGQEHALQGAGEVAWSFDVAAAPLQVCEVLVGTENFVMDHEGGITGPAGQLVAFDHAGDWWTFSNSWWCSDIGGASVVPGPYDARFAAQPGVNVVATEVVAHYAR